MRGGYKGCIAIDRLCIANFVDRQYLWNLQFLLVLSSNQQGIFVRNYLLLPKVCIDLIAPTSFIRKRLVVLDILSYSYYSSQKFKLGSLVGGDWARCILYLEIIGHDNNQGHGNNWVYMPRLEEMKSKLSFQGDGLHPSLSDSKDHHLYTKTIRRDKSGKVQVHGVLSVLSFSITLGKLLLYGFTFQKG